MKKKHYKHHCKSLCKCSFLSPPFPEIRTKQGNLRKNSIHREQSRRGLLEKGNLSAPYPLWLMHSQLTLELIRQAGMLLMDIFVLMFSG